ncbi:MAG TPA: beta-ketoacyl synthase chain length factor, partial [Burkholderiales bacterium]
EILHQLCEVLATPERDVSPTRFMNSVHNAAAGYWSIATQSREPSTSLCCYDWSFAAGLLETACQVAVNGKPAALIAYDEPYPEPLHSARPIHCEFGVALVLGPDKGLATLDVDFAQGVETRLDDAQLEAVRLGNPAARSLPLLAAIARGARAEIALQYGPAASLRVRVEPC